MNWIYTKVLTFMFGQALAHSDRVKTAIYGFGISGLLKLSAGCAICGVILTPETSDFLAKAAAGLTVSMIAALSHRDVAAPGQNLPGAALVLPLTPKP